MTFLIATIMCSRIPRPQGLDIVQLDFLIDDMGINSYHFKSEFMLQGRRRYGNFYVPGTDREFLYYFYKKIVKDEMLPAASGEIEKTLP